jgi:hypothetical protein
VGHNPIFPHTCSFPLTHYPPPHSFHDVIEMDDDTREDDDGILPRLFEIDYAGGIVAGKKGVDTLGIGGYQVRGRGGGFACFAWVLNGWSLVIWCHKVEAVAIPFLSLIHQSVSQSVSQSIKSDQIKSNQIKLIHAD